MPSFSPWSLCSATSLMLVLTRLHLPAERASVHAYRKVTTNPTLPRPLSASPSRIPQKDAPLASCSGNGSTTSAQLLIASDTSSLLAVAGTQMSTSESEKDMSAFFITPAALSLASLPTASHMSDVEGARTTTANRITRPTWPPSPSSSESDISPRKKRRTMELDSTPTVTIPTRHSVRSKNNDKLTSGSAQAVPAASRRPSISATRHSNHGAPQVLTNQRLEYYSVPGKVSHDSLAPEQFKKRYRDSSLRGDKAHTARAPGRRLTRGDKSRMAEVLETIFGLRHVKDAFVVNVYVPNWAHREQRVRAAHAVRHN
ncbi:hypothetical protein ONZ51_g12647 [Trametes cubensis]|uniref:Uncharacterized protein n=1 Tax=Trametes cubensis TaxID=1111947 RepID=A0AAD7X3G4_9APHY|nr:hypothetical protein ONZ51_g12647 [Trametes cubensis]